MIFSAGPIYSDYLEETEQAAMLPSPPSRGTSAVVAFIVLCLIVGVVFWLREELGIMGMLSVEYGEKYVR